jgi:hypothetical protein
MDADRHVIVRVLDDLGYCVYARGFCDGLHEGIVSLMILIVNPHSPQVGSRDGAWDLEVLVSIPCHIEPDMRFSLIRLSDNLLPAEFKACPRILRVGRSILTHAEAA